MADIPRRPLLGGGERLKERAEIPRGGGSSPHPYTDAEDRARLSPQGMKLGREVQRLDTHVAASHILVEAQLLPNYLAASHYPDELFTATGTYPVGTKPSKAPYKTAKRFLDAEPTK